MHSIKLSYLLTYLLTYLLSCFGCFGFMVLASKTTDLDLDNRSLESIPVYMQAGASWTHYATFHFPPTFNPQRRREPLARQA